VAADVVPGVLGVAEGPEHFLTQRGEVPDQFVDVFEVAVVLLFGAVLGAAFLDLRAGQFDDRSDGAEVLTLTVSQESR
jgi:hypothetical protein